jgi:hypothetical protein
MSLPYHGWTHAPKEQGGTDPIPGLAGVRIFRAWKYLLAHQVAIGVTHQAINWDWWENGDPTVFEPRTTTDSADPVIGTDLARYVRLLRPGRYIHTIQFQFTSSTTDGWHIALNDLPEDPWGMKEGSMEGPYFGDGWISYTIARVYPEVDIADSPPSHWPNFGAGGYVGSYWTVRKQTSNSTLRYARMEIHYEEASVPPPPESVPS